MTSKVAKARDEVGATEEEHVSGSSDLVYTIGLIGAWVYYFKRAASLQEYVLAFLKGLAWPAILVYQMLAFLNKE